MSAESLAAIAGVVLSLVFSYVPGLNKWFDGLEATYKRLIMLFLLFAVAGVSYGLSCVGYSNSFTCDQVGMTEAVKVFIAAMVANQGAYMLSPK